MPPDKVSKLSWQHLCRGKFQESTDEFMNPDILERTLVGTSQICLYSCQLEWTGKLGGLENEDFGMVQGEIRVNVGMWGGLVADNAGDHSVLQGMLDAGALGFKSFMVPSGLPCPLPHLAGVSDYIHVLQHWCCHASGRSSV